MKKIITINIGNKGVMLLLKNNYRVFDRLFIDVFNQTTLPLVNDFFNKYKNYDTYILLDTVAQNYNYKIFPNLNYFDLQNIVKRKFNLEIPKNDLKYKKFLYTNAENKKVYLFVSAGTDSPLKEWFNYFETIPNNILGIYMVPLESVELAKKILINSGNKKKIKEKKNWILLTFNNKTSDLRQVAIFNNNIAFTRLITLEPNNTDLTSFLKNDIIRTSEYIKRFDNEFSFDKLSIINILEQEIRDNIKNLKIEKSYILNLTPIEASRILKSSVQLVKRDEKYSDIIINDFIFKNNKSIRFANDRINKFFFFSNLFNVLKNINFILVSLIAFSIFIGLLGSLSYRAQIINLKNDLEKNKKELYSKSKQQFGMETSDVDKIIDAGSIKDLVDLKYVNPVESLTKFYDAQNNFALTEKISWLINNFNYQSAQKTTSVKIIYETRIINQEGDTDELFTKYDLFNAKLREIYKGSLDSISTLNNINFGAKYYTYPVKVEITERK